MAIDMKTLFAATHGDQDAKLQLKRSWLKEVYKLLLEGEVAKRELAALKRQIAERNAAIRKEFGTPEDMDEGFGMIDKGMDNIFGKGGAFDKIFGKGKKK